MAAIGLSAPGTEYGPCLEDCQHIDCAATREKAAVICPDCREPIGYDRPFYLDVGEHDDADWTKLAHATCMARRSIG